MKFNRNISVLATTAMLLFASCEESTTTNNDFENQANTRGTYSKEATVLSLCFLSNIGSGYRYNSPDSLFHTTDSLMNAVLKDPVTIHCIGNWQPVWGPCIYSDPLTEPYIAADLTMVLFKGTDPADSMRTMYVLSISGTNNVSVYDWLYVDLNDTSMFPWPVPVAGQSNISSFAGASSASNNTMDTSVTNSGIYVSTGMALGMKDLLYTMKNNQGNGKSLIDYLQANVTADSTTESAVTGHSMGGALSPCVALSLKDNQSYWDPENHFNITVYPFAGPTPGNANFAAYFMQTIDSVNFFGSYNTNDIAPCVANSQAMLTISSKYNDVPGFPQNQCLADGIFTCLAERLKRFNYTSLYSPSDSFTAVDSLPAGSFEKFIFEYHALPPNYQDSLNKYIGEFSACKQIAPDTAIAAFGCFGTLVLQQHFDAYMEEFHCDSVFIRIQRSQGPGLQKAGIVLAGRILAESMISDCL